MSEYYKRIEKIERISTHRYDVYGAPYCFSGFFSRSETSTSNVVVKGPGPSMAFVGKKSKSKIKNGSLKY